MAKIVIFGAGDIARLAHYYFTNDSDHEVVAFTVDKQYKQSDTFLDLPLIDYEDVAGEYPAREYKMFIALSYAKMNKIREQKYNDGKSKGYSMVSFVSSKCTYLSKHQPGDNCFILEDNTIQPFVKLGNNITLWSGNHIGHDSIIDDHCFITSHVVVSGNVHIKSNCFIGVNATIRNDIELKRESLIAAGAIVMKDTIEKAVCVPAKSILLRKKSDEIKIS